MTSDPTKWPTFFDNVPSPPPRITIGAPLTACLTWLPIRFVLFTLFAFRISIPAAASLSRASSKSSAPLRLPH